MTPAPLPTGHHSAQVSTDSGVPSVLGTIRFGRLLLSPVRDQDGLFEIVSTGASGPVPRLLGLAALSCVVFPDESSYLSEQPVAATFIALVPHLDRVVLVIFSCLTYVTM